MKVLIRLDSVSLIYYAIGSESFAAQQQLTDSVC